MVRHCKLMLNTVSYDTAAPRTPIAGRYCTLRYGRHLPLDQDIFIIISPENMVCTTSMLLNGSSFPRCKSHQLSRLDWLPAIGHCLRPQDRCGPGVGSHVTCQMLAAALPGFPCLGSLTTRTSQLRLSSISSSPQT